jgi:hypothetical protein
MHRLTPIPTVRSLIFVLDCSHRSVQRHRFTDRATGPPSAPHIACINHTRSDHCSLIMPVAGTLHPAVAHDAATHLVGVARALCVLECLEPPPAALFVLDRLFASDGRSPRRLCHRIDARAGQFSAMAVGPGLGWRRRRLLTRMPNLFLAYLPGWCTPGHSSASAMT